jgi:KUP system potassium uptake protein
VFGDIATSPLYTLQECLAGANGSVAARTSVFGCVSLIVWSLILVVSVKYVAVLMRADNRGEGGIMALLALVPRRLREPATGVLGVTTVFVLIGAAFLIGDGVITPAISVLSAVEGLRSASDKLESLIVPVTVIILVVLFALQRRGSGKLGGYFGPIMGLWLGTAGVLGIVHIAGNPEILTALSLHHGLRFLRDEGSTALHVLGGVVLSVTGAEALYADMGHFGRQPIRLAWYLWTFPMLVLCYLGQGALLLNSPQAASSSPFYSMVPQGAGSYPFILLGTAATVIASQALISGVFSLVHQAIQLGYFPRVTVVHTSGEEKGQIYLPLLNWFLAASCVALVVAFRESSRLAAAYGLAVSGTMLVTSLAFYSVAQVRFHWSKATAASVVLAFLVLDGAFLSATLLKFFDGGYIPVLVGLVFFAVMLVWARGRSLLSELFRRQSESVESFLSSLPERIEQRLDGVGVIMTATAESIPPVLSRMVARFRALHATTLLTTVITEEIPYVAHADQVTVSAIDAGIFRVILRYGFMEKPHVHDAIAQVLSRVAPSVPREEVIYVLGRESFVGGAGGNMGRVSEAFLQLLSRNAKDPTDFFALPDAQVVELGIRIDL